MSDLSPKPINNFIVKTIRTIVIIILIYAGSISIDAQDRGININVTKEVIRGIHSVYINIIRSIDEVNSESIN